MCKKLTTKSINIGQQSTKRLLAKRMLKYLEDSEALKVSTRELKEQVLSPIEPRVRIVRIAEKQKAVPDFQQTRSERDRSRQYGEMEGAFAKVGCAGEGMPGTQGRS